MATAKPPKAKTSGFTAYIRPSQEVLRQIDDLVQMGLFGDSRTAVTEELMRAHLRQLHREGWFDAKLSQPAKRGAKR